MSTFKKQLFTFFIFFAASMATHAQTRVIKHVEKPPLPEDYTIAFTKYQLPNGLTLIVHEDHSDPIVHVDVTYHVGSAREETGMSGFAHFFEHMMFQGSKNVGDEEHFKIINGAGGTMNGTTNRDRTNYFETVPKNYLETALWLEADRMGFLLDAVSQKKFEVQRATVKNEKGQRYENRPYGMVGEIGSKSFYPFGHPYSWPTIGYVEDLNRVGVEELKKFFLRWYGPNNAVVTVGGDVKKEEVVKLVEKYFGSIPPGPEVKKAAPEYFKLESDRYISYEDNIRFPMLKMMFPGVETYHADEAALDILAEILGQGKNSILYQNLIKTKKAVQASASNPTAELGGEFSISVLAFPDTKLADIEVLLRQAIDDFVKRGISEDDLEKAKASREASAIYGLESVSGKVSQLAAYETFLGDPNYIREDVQRYKNVTKEDIVRVYNTYIKNQKALILSVYPKGKKNLAAKEDNFKPGGDSSSVKHANYDTLKVRTVQDNFNRSKRPKTGSSPVVNMPASFTTKLVGPMSEMKIMGVTNKELPTVYMQFNIKAGQVYQPKGKEGIAYLLSKMLQESTHGYSAEKMEQELDKLGSNVHISVDEENISIGVSSLKKNIQQTMMLVSEIIMHPAFKEDEFARVKKQQIEYIGNQSTQADAIANQTFNQLVYGKESPVATSLYGTAQSVEKLDVRELRMYFMQNFSPGNISLVVSGDIESKELEQLLMPFMGLRPAPGAKQPIEAESPKIEKTKIYLVNKEGAPQSELRVGYLAMPYDATGEFYRANIMNYILGGAFNSRINLNLREEKGYTYGARSSFNGSHRKGPWRVATGVRGDATDSAVVEILKEIKNYREGGITKDELKFVKNSMLEREALKYETNSQKASYVERMLEYKLADNFVKEQVAVLKSIKAKEIKKLAQKHLPIDNMVIVVVGDAKSVKPGLAKLGYEVIEMDAASIGMKN